MNETVLVNVWVSAGTSGDFLEMQASQGQNSTFKASISRLCMPQMANLVLTSILKCLGLGLERQPFNMASWLAHRAGRRPRDDDHFHPMPNSFVRT